MIRISRLHLTTAYEVVLSIGILGIPSLYYWDRMVVLWHYLYGLVGPTLPVLIVLATYNIGMIIMSIIESDHHWRAVRLAEARRFSNIAVSVGMIGTYIAIMTGLNAEGGVIKYIPNALLSTLAALFLQTIVQLSESLLVPLSIRGNGHPNE